MESNGASAMINLMVTSAKKNPISSLHPNLGLCCTITKCRIISKPLYCCKSKWDGIRLQGEYIVWIVYLSI